MVSFFTAREGALVAGAFARSPWAPGMLGGTAVCGLLARELETHCPGGYVPARLTVDLFRPVPDTPLRPRSRVVRRGNRISVADAWVEHDGTVLVRATAVFLTTGATPPGQVWSPARDLPVPPPGCLPETGAPPLFKSGDGDWSDDFTAHQNAERKHSWHSLPSLVAGEPISPFQRAAFLGDAANQVCHWGSAGAGYINADVTVTLARLPIGHEIGLRADDTVAADGISIGTATMYDRTGALGTCVVTTLSNAARQVDFTDEAVLRAIR